MPSQEEAQVMQSLRLGSPLRWLLKITLSEPLDAKVRISLGLSLWRDLWTGTKHIPCESQN